MWSHDIKGSIVHAKMLTKQDIISEGDGLKIVEGLKQIYWDMEAGKKLHTARSRNDQVAVDFRLYQKDSIDGIQARLRGSGRHHLPYRQRISGGRTWIFRYML